MDALTLHRIAHACHRHRVPIIPRLLQRINFVLFHCYVPASLALGEGTRLGYGGLGIVLHERARIGRNVFISQQVTIGGRARRFGVPTIEDDCFIGVGARVLGPIRLGAGSIVGANAVVLHDVPPRSVVAGVPARIVRTGVVTGDYRGDVPRESATPATPATAARRRGTA
jgi:serine O-acetyltransferase